MSADQTQHDDERSASRFDPVTLIAGLITLAVSGYVLSGGPQWIGIPDGRWILAGVAVVVGIGMLAASLRGDRS